RRRSDTACLSSSGSGPFSRGTVLWRIATRLAICKAFATSLGGRPQEPVLAGFGSASRSGALRIGSVTQGCLHVHAVPDRRALVSRVACASSVDRWLLLALPGFR